MRKTLKRWVSMILCLVMCMLLMPTAAFADDTKTLTGIAITTAPAKTIYTVGEDFSTDGMVVTATYDDESTQDVTSSVTVTDGENLAGYKTEVTIKYTEGTVTKITTQAITVLPTYTVTFNMKGHGTAPDQQVILYGNKATKPDAPTAEDYRFDGWYKNAECTTEFDFDAAITRNVTVFAKWTQIGDYGITVNGTKITSENTDDVFAGTVDAGKVSYNSDTKLLKINGYLGTSSSKDSVTIVGNGENDVLIDGGSDVAVYGKLTISNVKNVQVRSKHLDRAMIQNGAEISCSGSVTLTSQLSEAVTNGTFIVKGATDVTVTGYTYNGSAVVCDTDINCSGNVKIENIGNAGSAVEGKLTVKKAANVTLISKGNHAAITNGADISCSGAVAISSSGHAAVMGAPLTVTSATDVTLTSKGTATTVESDVDITCSGNVTFTSARGAVTGNLKISGANNVTITANTSGVSYQKAVYGDATISCSGDVKIVDGAITGKLTVNKAKDVSVTVTAKNNTDVMIRGGADITCTGNVVLNSSDSAVYNGLTVKGAADVTVIGYTLKGLSSPAVVYTADITCSGDVRIENTGTGGSAVRGDLTVTGAKNVTLISKENYTTLIGGADISCSGAVKITSENDSAVDGSEFAITGASDVTITGKINCSGNVSILNENSGMTVHGNLDATAKKDLTVSAKGSGNMITGNAVIASDGKVLLENESGQAVSGTFTFNRIEKTAGKYAVEAGNTLDALSTISIKDGDETYGPDSINKPIITVVDAYNVAFNMNGHGTPIPEQQDIASGSKVPEPVAPSEDGYDFDGWFKDADCINKWDFDHDVVTADTELNAKWTKLYTVSFEMDGFGTAPDAQIVRDGETASEPAVPSVDHYDFGGWYTDADCSTEFDFTTAITEDTILYAKWTEIPKFTVTFDMDGIGTAPEDQTVERDEMASKPADPSEDGYIFDGWYPDSAYGTEFDFTSAITEDTTIYAKWTEIPQYAVTFEMSGIGIAPETQYVREGKKPSEPAAPTADGYEFNGWYADETCTIAFDFTVAITEDTSVYAKWTEIPRFTVTFDMGGIGTAPADQTVEIDKTPSKPADPSEDGYTFDGWYADAACSVEFVFTTPITADTIVYAKWTETLVYKIVSGADGTWTKDSGVDYELTVKRVPKDETCFGHFTTVEIDGTVLTAGTDYEAKAGSTVVTLKASTLQNLSVGKHTVTVNFDDGKAETTLTIKVAATQTDTSGTGSTSKTDTSGTGSTSKTDTSGTETTSKTDTSGTGSTSKTTTPQTGDNSNMVLWISMMLIALFVLGFVSLYGMKKKARR